jgi:hypothetical protein
MAPPFACRRTADSSVTLERSYEVTTIAAVEMTTRPPAASSIANRVRDAIPTSRDSHNTVAQSPW